MASLKDHELSRKIVNGENRMRVSAFVVWSTAPVFAILGIFNVTILYFAMAWSIAVILFAIHAWYSYLMLKARNEPVYLALCIEQGGEPDVIAKCKERFDEIANGTWECDPCHLKFNGAVDFCLHVYDEHTKRRNKKPVWRLY